MLSYQKVKKGIKKNKILYAIYTAIRYRNKMKVRDWARRNKKFHKEHNLNTFIFEAGDVYVRTNSGAEFIYVEENMGGLLGLEYKNGFEKVETDIILALLPEEPTFLDVGANFGYYTISVAKAKPKSQIHAFEPVQETAHILWRNAERNSVTSRVTLNSIAVSQKVQNLTITEDRYAGNYLVDGNEYEGVSREVSSTSLDEYANEKNFKKIDFIKCDVEGAELMVMQGAVELLKHKRPIIMMEISSEWTTRFGYAPADLVEFMRKRDYCVLTTKEAAEKLGLKSVSLIGNNYFFIPTEVKIGK